jgi:outer membrane protein
MRSSALFLASVVALTVPALAEEHTRTLSLAEARAIALQKHPKLSAAELSALAARQVIAQQRAAAMPNLNANLGAVATSESGIRVASTGLSLSGVYDRASAAMNVSQMITDFGRTSNLVASSRFKADAESQQVQVTRTQLLFEVEAAYYGVLQAKALLDVADQAVKTRTLLRDNTTALFKNQLKSALDVSFAEVNLQDASLLLSRTRNDVQSAYATLARLLTDKEETVYDLRTPAAPAPLRAKVESLVETALHSRPELNRLRLEREAALKFAAAERALSHPTLSLQGTAGVLPYRDDELQESYAAGGLILNWTLGSGGLNAARRRESELKAQVAEQLLKDKEAEVTRDVQLAWLNANNAAERLQITTQLHDQAKRSYALAEARYNAGSSSVVELSQAQFNLTSAEITQATTRYEYLIRRAALDFQLGAHAHSQTPPSTGKSTSHPPRASQGK